MMFVNEEQVPRMGGAVGGLTAFPHSGQDKPMRQRSYIRTMFALIYRKPHGVVGREGVRRSVALTVLV